MTATTATPRLRTPRGDVDRRAAEAGEKRYQAAYEAGQHGVSEEEHFAGRDDVTDLERQSYQAGVTERRAGRRRDASKKAGRHLRSVAGTSGGYLARAGRSVTDADIPTASGGSWTGLLVGVLALVALYILLGNRNNVATSFINGVFGGLRWLAAPTPLPF